MDFITLAIIVAILGVFVFVGVIWFFTRSKGNINSIFFEERNDGSVILMGSKIPIQFRKDQTGNIDAFKVKGLPDFKPLSRNYFYPTSGSRKDTLILLRDKEGNVDPCLFDMDDKGRIVLKPNRRTHIDFIVYEEDRKNEIKMKKGNWDKYMPTVTSFICLGIIFITAYFSWQHDEKMMSSINTKEAALDTKIARWSELYNPEVLLKAQQILLQQKINVQTQNWTTTTIT